MERMRCEEQRIAAEKLRTAIIGKRMELQEMAKLRKSENMPGIAREKPRVLMSSNGVEKTRCSKQWKS